VRVQHRAGRPTGAHARERAHARGGAHWRHALPVRHAAVDAAAHRGAGARARGARPCRQQRRARVAHALALAASSALSPRRSFMHGPVPASSAAAMCLQASHHHRPAHLRASCHACARGLLALTTGLAGKASGSQRLRRVPAASCIRWRSCPAQSADEASAPSRASLNITFEHALQHTCGRLARCHWPWLRLVRPCTSACPGEARTLCVRHGCMASRGSPGFCGSRCMPGPVHPQERALCCIALIEHDGGSARAALTLQVSLVR